MFCICCEVLCWQQSWIAKPSVRPQGTLLLFTASSWCKVNTTTRYVSINMQWGEKLSQSCNYQLSIQLVTKEQGSSLEGVQTHLGIDFHGLLSFVLQNVFQQKKKYRVKVASFKILSFHTNPQTILVQHLCMFYCWLI